MWLLVDYGNIGLLDKQRGLSYVVDMLINRIGPLHLESNELVNVRLYDGWYEGDVLSRHAQNVAAQIAAFNPSIVTVRHGEQNFRVIANVELARSLISNPSKDILHTYRVRGFPSGLQCENPPFAECSIPHSCPWQNLPEFLLRRRCPMDGCDLHPKRIISRAEQKIVDTMLTADMIELGLQREGIAVASSDDDMIPGISLALARGANVVHLQTKQGQTTAEHYFERFSERYMQVRAV